MMSLSYGRKLPSTRPNRRQDGARFALWTLSTINLLNFADRYIPSAVKALIQEELNLTDVQTALPVTGMVLVYMLSAPVFGVLVDKNAVDRRTLLAGAVALWSLATALAGFAQDLTQLVLFRAFVGIGEAAFTSIVPPMLSDFYPLKDRNMMFTVYSLAAPLGGALGFGAGALLGSWFGWRAAFFVCGTPGLLVALVIMFVNDPARGVNDEGIHQESESDGKPFRWISVLQDGRSIMTNTPYLVATLGMCANCFAVGAFADWYDTLLVRYTGASLAVAGLVLAAATVVGGIGGSLLGAKAAQYYELKCKSAYFLVPALFTIPGAVLASGAVNLLFNSSVAFSCMIAGEIFFFTYGPPMQTVSVSVMPVYLRSRSSGIQILLVHILGDIISPPIVGLVSDHTGSLQKAMQLAWVAIAISGLIWFLGYRLLPPLPTSSSSSQGSADENGPQTTLLALLLVPDEGEIEDKLELSAMESSLTSSIGQPTWGSDAI